MMYAISNGCGTLTARGTTFEAVQRSYARMVAEPWREYVPWGPDDMPPRGGDKVALRRVADCAEDGEPCAD